MSEDAIPEDRYLRILDTAPDAMLVVGADSKIVFVNARTEELFGYARSQLLGRPLDCLIPEALGRANGHLLSGYLAAPTSRPLGSGVELAGRRADGSAVEIEVSCSPFSTEQGSFVSAAIRDITERKRSEAEARLATERLTSAVESIEDAFALFDRDDRVAFCNGAYRRFIGESCGGPIGRAYEDVFGEWLPDLVFPDEEARAQFRASRYAARRGTSATHDVRTRDGRTLRVSDRRTADGDVVTTIRDMTEDVAQAEELRDARVLAEEGSAAKSTFLASMSHELRTPLNAILGFAQLLHRDKKEPLSARHRARVEQILQGGEHLLHLIDDILDLSRIEAGGVAISTEPVDALEVLHEVIATLEPLATRANVRVELAAPPENGVPLVAADRTRYAQILMNLGSNAIKYNRAGGTVTFALEPNESGNLRAIVTDTGLGIPLDKQPKMFQPFQRAGQETGPIEGTGIGLSITKRLAELMNGRVGFSSVPTKGSTFWIEIPIHRGAGFSAPSPLHSQAPRPGRAPHGRVLYVEDNPANVRFMKELLGGFEHVEMQAAPTAELGVELARCKPPHLIIMDVNLPGMSGIDALAALRRYPETKDIPVIALTAAASERDRKRGEQAGFHRYLTKPVNVAELETAVEEILSSASEAAVE